MENVNPNQTTLLVGENSYETTRNSGKSDIGDSKEFVSSCLQRLGMEKDVDDKDLSKPAIRVIESLFNEKSRWEGQCVAHMEECSKLRHQVTTLAREKEKEANGNASIKHDGQLLNSRISSLNAEHREIRNHWLGEKSDLEGRLFQLHALNTQMQGTMKKKEKESAKLQLQLAKLVKDAARGNKAIINISVPLKKNLSQLESNKGNGSLLRDAEIISNKATNANLNKENAYLRHSMELMRSNVHSLREQFDSSVALAELKYQNQTNKLVEEHGLTLQQKEGFMEDLQLRITIAVEEAAVKAAAAAILTPSVHRRVVPGSLAKQYLEGTPGARPVRWVVEQVNTEIKRLRKRAELAGEGCEPTLDCKAQYVDYSEFLNSNPKYSAMKVQLMEALAVIQEQDRLIHEALLGRLPSTMVDLEKAIPSFAGDGEEQDNINSQALHTKDGDDGDDSDDQITTGSTGQGSSRPSLKPLWIDDCDFMPPASPATLEVLQAYGWSNPPRRQCSSAKPRPFFTYSPRSASLTLANSTGDPSSSNPHSTFKKACAGQHLDF